MPFLSFLLSLDHYNNRRAKAKLKLAALPLTDNKPSRLLNKNICLTFWGHFKGWRGVYSKKVSQSRVRTIPADSRQYFAPYAASHKDEDTGKRKAARYSSQNVLSGLFIRAECGASCHAPSIPEMELQDAVCKMLSLDTFNPETVRSKLESIRVDSDGSFLPVYMENPVFELSL